MAALRGARSLERGFGGAGVAAWGWEEGGGGWAAAEGSVLVRGFERDCCASCSGTAGVDGWFGGGLVSCTRGSGWVMDVSGAGAFRGCGDGGCEGRG